ncbi:MAG: lactoylglutathione lyase [Bdellovibrio sp. CG12_big_fil_rev_8_21_14_0_65_39_13]|nr:MAG: lactoylglutathione lyase [Bdellovibrio sp. CG22_combo_CG10-13_8_21_14_all_39_27]PIQ62025.1 MAG: lactoylglutathione lyase [Bdellovibrio sp. CG12_big_fil_rev_8_21_14_0_65_39_13]PIR34107.1 MAG: lactoylglutathione lyase [Bdellovibrio sp. CG11_big_fil_rev_8_21_14_0_20_39_38]
MRFLHTMIRVKDLDAALTFFCQDLGLIEIRRQEFPEGKFTLVFLSTHEGAPEIELTYNWDQSEPYSIGRFFGHMAFEVENIYETCQRLMDRGITINRPPRDGYMAFIKSPDQVSIELLQKGPALAKQEPWLSMPNTGTW